MLIIDDQYKFVIENDKNVNNEWEENEQKIEL